MSLSQLSFLNYLAVYWFSQAWTTYIMVNCGNWSQAYGTNNIKRNTGEIRQKTRKPFRSSITISPAYYRCSTKKIWKQTVVLNMINEPVVFHPNAILMFKCSLTALLDCDTNFTKLHLAKSKAQYHCGSNVKICISFTSC